MAKVIVGRSTFGLTPIGNGSDAPGAICRWRSKFYPPLNYRYPLIKPRYPPSVAGGRSNLDARRSKVFLPNGATAATPRTDEQDMPLVVWARCVRFVRYVCVACPLAARGRRQLAAYAAVAVGLRFFRQLQFQYAVS